MGFAIFDAFSGGTPDYAGQAQAAEDKRQGAITEGKGKIRRAFAGFGPGFYNQRAKAYQDFALPQLAEQYQTTRNQIGFGLANKGLRKSATAGKQWSDLFRAEGVAKQGIADTGLAQANDLKRQIAQAQQNLTNQLYVSADPANAQQQAISTAAGFQAPSTFAPLVNQFSGLLNQYYISQLLNQKPSPSLGAPADLGGGGYGSGFAPLPAASSSIY